MIDITKGRYWDLPWSLVDGCTPCSPGCDHCWSANIRHRFEGGLTKDGFVPHTLTNVYGTFNGYIKTHPERLSIPLKRRRPTVYAVWNDLFHEAVPWTFQNEAYGVMLEPSNHTYLILTKRPGIMFEHLLKINIPDMPPNIWHGLTVCNQQEADEKIPVFLQVPGKKFLSIEPMLGPVNLSDIVVKEGPGSEWHFSALKCDVYPEDDQVFHGDNLSAVILGGETSLGARPMHPDWVRSVRDQCTLAGVPFFFKEWGEWQRSMDYYNKYQKNFKGVELYLSADGQTFTEENYMLPKQGTTYAMAKIGRKESGRLLDGRTHDDLPWATKER